MIWAGQRQHKERGPAAGGISDAERELFGGRLRYDQSYVLYEGALTRTGFGQMAAGDRGVREPVVAGLRRPRGGPGHPPARRETAGANRSYVLHEGHLAEEGTHDQLMPRPTALYRDMHTAQAAQLGRIPPPKPVLPAPRRGTEPRQGEPR
ncbi:hypothetical protein [Streptomyces sp. Caat 7-52]|uniref:hypothetical protein n=1 Tax=Streptomyces sp. Caat 7-52 TaxID=2949637 RepID=UPI0020352951|nr:hypothetical protein [Streptomyces sp. Caat 7-52]